MEEGENMNCPCNCHNPNFRKDFNIEEHSDCGICFTELFEEAQALNEYMEKEYEKNTINNSFFACNDSQM